MIIVLCNSPKSKEPQQIFQYYSFDHWLISLSNILSPIPGMAAFISNHLKQHRVMYFPQSLPHKYTTTTDTRM